MKQQPPSANRVFIADDQPEVLDLLADKLRSRGKVVEAFPSGARLTERLAVDDDGVELVVLEVMVIKDRKENHLQSKVIRVRRERLDPLVVQEELVIKEIRVRKEK